MQNQAILLQQDITIEFLPHPSDMPYRIVVINNPVLYVDPSGNWFFMAMGIGALIGGGSAAINGGDILEGALIGAASAAVGYGAGAFVGNAVGLAAGGCAASCTSTAYYASAIAGGAAGGAAAGGASAALYGGDVGRGALFGAFAGGVGGFLGTFNYGNPQLEGMVQIGSGGAIGGIASELNGGSFWDGFASGAMSGAVAFGVNRYFEAKRYASSIKQEKAKVFRELKVTADEIKWMKNNPTKDLPRTLGNKFGNIRAIAKRFGSEIDYIREAGTGCGDCLRFGNFHVKSYNNQTYIHFDRGDAVFSLGYHLLVDM